MLSARLGLNNTRKNAVSCTTVKFGGGENIESVGGFHDMVRPLYANLNQTIFVYQVLSKMWQL